MFVRTVYLVKLENDISCVNMKSGKMHSACAEYTTTTRLLSLKNKIFLYCLTLQLLLCSEDNAESYKLRSYQNVYCTYDCKGGASDFGYDM